MAVLYAMDIIWKGAVELSKVAVSYIVKDIINPITPKAENPILKYKFLLAYPINYSSSKINTVSIPYTWFWILLS